MEQMNDSLILTISKDVVCSIRRTVWHIHDREWRVKDLAQVQNILLTLNLQNIVALCRVGMNLVHT